MEEERRKKIIEEEERRMQEELVYCIMVSHKELVKKNFCLNITIEGERGRDEAQKGLSNNSYSSYLAKLNSKTYRRKRSGRGAWLRSRGGRWRQWRRPRTQGGVSQNPRNFF